MKRAGQCFAESRGVSAMALRDLPKLAAGGLGKRVGAFEFGELREQRDEFGVRGRVGARERALQPRAQPDGLVEVGDAPHDAREDPDGSHQRVEGAKLSQVSQENIGHVALAFHSFSTTPAP
ncbi:hypothetical protein PT2222_40345 [Paraburkholderia tropica]